VRDLALFAGGFAAGAISMWAVILWTLGEREQDMAQRSYDLIGLEYPNG
jgi:hypothetical protein